MSVHDFGQEKWLMHKEYPSEASRRAFVKAYADECKRLGTFDNWDENGADSVDNILLQCDFGILCSRINMLSSVQVGFADFGHKMIMMRKDVDPEFTEQVSLLPSENIH